MAKKKKKHRRTRSSSAAADVIGMMGQTHLEPHETFRFECLRCGGCCWNVRNSIPLESIDVFRLVKHLRKVGYFTCDNIAETIPEIAVATEISEGGYFMLCMKTEQPQDKCIFLNGDTCDVHEAKPRACRIYPLSAYPNNGYTGIQLSIDKREKRHFTGRVFSAGGWLNNCYDAEDKDYTLFEPRAVVAIEQRLRQVSGCPDLYFQARAGIMQYKYLEMDLERAFMPQYRANMGKLLHLLDELVLKAVMQREKEV